MSSEVTDATLEYLARRLDELATEFPREPEGVDLVTLTDHVYMLAHCLGQATELAQDRFAAPATVRPPESRALVRLSRATGEIARALDILASGLTSATIAFALQDEPDLVYSRPRNDASVLRTLAEKYVAAGALLRGTAGGLRAFMPPRRSSTPRRTGPQPQPAASPPPRQRTRS